MDGYIDEQIDKQIARYMDGKIDRWIDEIIYIDGYINGNRLIDACLQMNRQIN